MIKPRICKLHNQQCIAIDLNPKCDVLKRHLCFNCLKDCQTLTQSIFQYPQANNYFLAVKNQFQSLKNQQNLQNIEILDSLLESVIELKKQKINALDQLQQYLENQKQAFEIQMRNIENELVQLDIDSYLSIRHELNQSKINLEQFQTDFLNYLKETQTPMDQFIKKIEQIEKQSIKLIPVERVQINIEEQIKLSFQCPEHNKDITFIDLNKQILACEDCVSKKEGIFKKLSEANELWEIYKVRQKKQLINELENSQLIQKNCQSELKEVQKGFNIEINQIKKTMDEKFKVQQYQILNMIKSRLYQEWSTLNIEEIKDIVKIMSNSDQLTKIQYNQNQEFEIFLENLKQVIEALKKNSFYLNQIFFEKNMDSIIFDQQIRPRKSNRDLKIKNKIIDMRITTDINYVVIPQNQIQKHSNCSALAFNKEQNILVAGCGGSIIIFDFLDGQLTIQQQYDKLTKAVTCIQFMNINNQFVVGCYDDQMQIWNQNYNKQWFCQQTLYANQSQINSIAADQNLLISASQDGLIKFWAKNQEWMCQQTIQIFDSQVFCLSLNQASKILAACGYFNDKTWLKKHEGFVAIYKENQHQVWQQIQTIKWLQQINKLCFLGNDLLVFKTSRCGVTYILKNEQNTFKQQGEYKQAGDSLIDNSLFFPLIYNKAKSLYLNKIDKILTIIRFDKKKSEFQKYQEIKFETQVLEGAMTDNGEYLIIWDNVDQTFKVMQQY